MKLAFCLFNYFPYGGLQRDFMRIAQECIMRGHSIDVFTMRWDGPMNPLLPVTLISSKGWQNHTRCKNFYKQLQAHLTKQSYDLIIGFNKMPGLDLYYAADTCFQAKANKQHGPWYRLTPRYHHAVAFEQAVFAANSKTQILLLSKLQQPEFLHFYQTPASRFQLLPPGISKDYLAPTDAAVIRSNLRQEFHIKEKDYLLLMVGSGFKTKGLDRILLGIASLPNHLTVHLFVIGKDHQESYLRQAKKLGIAHKIKFLGGRDDVPRFMLAADLLVHPAYNENTGTVLLEALASGLPVLTTEVCGYAGYILQAKAGRVLPSPYQQSLFNQTLRDMLLSNDRTSWQTNALKFAKQADIYSLPKKAAEIIESMRNN